MILRNHATGILLVLFLLVTLLSLSPPAAAVGTETLITTGTFPSTQDTPSIYGDIIVWQDSRHSVTGHPYSDIYMYDAANGIERRITAAGSYANSPAIWDDQIVWYAEKNGNYDIYLYNLTTGTTTPVAVAIGNQKNPAIFNDMIVWDDERAGIGNKDLFLYFIGNGTERQITSAAGNQEYPAIHGGNIVWQDDSTDSPGFYNIDMYNLSNGRTINVTAESGSDQKYPSVFNSRVVWQDDRNWLLGNSGKEIWMDDTSGPPSPMIIGTDPTFDLADPFIFGDYVVWTDGRNSNNDIYAYQISTATADIQITSNGTEQSKPKIYNDRIVWQDARNGQNDIFMYTFNVDQSCTADFSSPPTSAKNAAVSFTNTSTGWQTNWSWTFGDGGTAFTANPAHTYTSSGTFPVNLTVNNPYCRNMTPLIPSRYISIDDAPVANFDANITVGMVPLIVKFTNTSVGWQTNWNWTFGDGGTDTSANPVHTYSTKGIYSVSLDTTNDYGNNTLQKNSYIHALGGASATQNTTIAGITITTVAGQPQLNFDKATLTDYLFKAENNLVLVCVPPASSGFQQITFYSLDGTGFSETGTTISGSLSRTSLMSSVVQPSGFPAALGIPISVNYTIDYPGYPTGASVTMNVYDDTEPDYSDFLNTAKGAHFTSILGLPYIVQFQTTNIGTGYQATLNMSVDSAWVAGHGGTGQMYAIRLDYPYGEVLPISLISQDGTNNHYGTVSPNGLSKFTLSGLSGSGNVFQMVYLGVVQHFVDIQSSSDTSDGLVADTAKGTGQGLTSQQGQPLASAPEPPAAPEAKSVDLFINEQAVVTQTTILQSRDQLATLSIGQGVVAKDSAGSPLSSVTIASMPDFGIPEMPQGSTFRFAGIAYNLQPDGATFSPAVTITFTVPQAQWSQHYMVKEYDPLAEVWVDLPTTYHPESGTISASVSHFCVIALFSDTIKPSQAPPRTTVQTPLPTIAPPPPTSPFGVFYGMVAWLADMFMKNMYLFLIVAAIAVAFYVNRRRKGRDPLRFK